MTEEDETKSIDRVIERLGMRFPEVPATTVEEAVPAAHREFVDAPVRDFVPLLVEHEALTRLKELAGRADLGVASQGADGERWLTVAGHDAWPLTGDTTPGEGAS